MESGLERFLFPAIRNRTRVKVGSERATERSMRSLAICAAVMISALVATGRAEALAGWCGKSPSGATSCGFATLAECAAKISNTGGACIQNSGSGAKTAEPEHARRERPERPKKEAAPK